MELLEIFFDPTPVLIFIALFAAGFQFNFEGLLAALTSQRPSSSVQRWNEEDSRAAPGTNTLIRMCTVSTYKKIRNLISWFPIEPASERVSMI